jgi:hypothetical protein
MVRAMSRRHGHAKRGQRIILHRPAGSTVELGHPELSALRAVILNLDAAANTGVAVFINGRLRAYDECDANDPHARMQVVRECMHAAEVRGLPLALVTEAPWGGYVSAAVSLAGTVRLWRDTWRTLARDPWHFLELTAGQWRRAIIGRASMTREQARHWEACNARAVVYADMRPHERSIRDACLKPTRIGADAAAAISMGQATCRSSGVRKRLGCDLVRPPLAAKVKTT